MKKTLLLLTLMLIFAQNAHFQTNRLKEMANNFSQLPSCNFLSTASLSGDTLHCYGGNNYKTSVAYNPVAGYYYSVNAGGIDADETYYSNGTYLSGAATIDWRGLWYNPQNGLMEGNVWGNAILSDSMVLGGQLGGTAKNICSSIMPNIQSVGVYDYVDQLILYHDNGIIHSQDRITTLSNPTLTLTGISSFTNILPTTLIYTGCTGKEIGLYEYVNKKVYLFNITTGALADSVSLPSNAPANGYLNGHFAFANNQLWLYHSNSNVWVGYNLFTNPSAINGLETSTKAYIYPNPVKNNIQLGSLYYSSIKIYSVLGTEIPFEIIDEHTIDVNKLVPGVYFIYTGEGQSIKFIKE